MATQRCTLWSLALLVSCLVRPAAGFVGNAAAVRLTTAVTICPRTSARSRAATTRSSSSGSTLYETRRRRNGVGGVHAAFEVELSQDLEIGSVLVAGADNYGSMTFKVRHMMHRVQTFKLLTLVRVV